MPGHLIYCDELLATHSTPELDDHPLSAGSDYLFGILKVPPYLEAVF
jgi:hypothetical protein